LLGATEMGEEYVMETRFTMKVEKGGIEGGSLE
jgi:hypothetical protein